MMRRLFVYSFAMILAACGPAAAPAAPVAEGATIDAAGWTIYTPWNSDLPEVVKTGSGLEYVVLESGPADGATLRKDQNVEMFYEGRLASGGEAFDSAFARGKASVFPVDGLVPGGVEVLQLMRPGDRWLARIPSELGYGARGTPGGPIPPNADLVMEMLVVGAR